MVSNAVRAALSGVLQLVSLNLPRLVGTVRILQLDGYCSIYWHAICSNMHFIISKRPHAWLRVAHGVVGWWWCAVYP